MAPICSVQYRACMIGSSTDIGVVTRGEGRVWGVGGSVCLLFDYQYGAPICSKCSAGHCDIPQGLCLGQVCQRRPASLAELSGTSRESFWDSCFAGPPLQTSQPGEQSAPNAAMSYARGKCTREVIYNQEQQPLSQLSIRIQIAGI